MTRYYTLDSATNDLVSLRPPVVIDGRQRLHPSPAQAAALGAYPRNDTYYPTDDPPEGKMWRRTVGWTVRDGSWCANFEAVDIPPPPPRTFSKLRIVAALMDAGVWAQAKELIEQAGLYDLFLVAQDFAEDNEFFERGKSTLQTALGWTDEQVDAVLAAAAV